MHPLEANRMRSRLGVENVGKARNNESKVSDVSIPEAYPLSVWISQHRATHRAHRARPSEVEVGGKYVQSRRFGGLKQRESPRVKYSMDGGCMHMLLCTW